MLKQSTRPDFLIRLRRIPVLALLCFTIFELSAQVTPDNKLYASTIGQSLSIDPSFLSISDGLASPDVRSIIQDGYGLIWIGTNNGLQKYDGYSFETFKNIPGKPNSLQNNVIWGLLEDRDHSIWVATAKGVSRYDRVKNTFINYDIARILNLNTGAGLVFNLLLDSQNRLWATTFNTELLYYDRGADAWKPAVYDVPTQPENSLHLSTALSIAEDGEGGLWFGSGAYGLMYRAKDKTTFTVVPIEKSSGVDFTDPLNRITYLFVDSLKVVWITARNGVYKYYPGEARLKTIEAYDYLQIDNWNNWNCIQRDHDGNVWIANNFRGLLKFEGISDRFQQVPITQTFKLKGAGYNVTFTDFFIDKTGIFWFGTQTQGVMKYDPEKKPFSGYTHGPGNPQSIASNAVFGMTASSLYPNLLYVGTRGEGVSIFDQSNKTFRRVKYKPVNDLYEGAVRSIGEDADGNLWLGTWGDGLIGLDKNYREVKRYTRDSKSETSISNNQVRVIKKDAKGNFWVGTNGGLNYFQPRAGQFKRITSKTTQIYPSGLTAKLEHLENAIASILEVPDNKNLTAPFEVKEAGTYLIAMVGEGDAGSMADVGWLENTAGDSIWTSLNFYQTNYAGGADKNRIKIDLLELAPGTYKLRYKTDDSHAFGKWNSAPPDLTSLYGTVVFKVNNAAEKQSIQALLTTGHNELAISGSNISAIAVTDQYIWVGTNPDGLNRMDPSGNAVKTYQYDPSNDNTINSNVITDVAVDENGMVWITTDAGLNKLDPKTDSITHYTEQDGLPTNLVENVLPGTNGELWLSTQNGLSQMVTNQSLGKVTFINYSSEDGLLGDAFLTQVAARMPDGQFYFGGDQGLNAVSKVKANNFPPDLIISNLLISNKSVFDMGGDSPLAGELLSYNPISLAFNQNNLSFEFAALHYANPKKNQYAHILKGYDKDWVYDNRNYASYTNLAPGEYEFVVRASNAYGVWNEQGKSIKITILPPWYATWWAYLLYALAFIGIAYLLFRYQRKRIVHIARERARAREMQHAKEIEKAYTELKATQTQLIHSEKMASLGELTAGIAHEIQNPLNFVNNFSELNAELIEELKSEIAKDKSERDENLETELLNDIAQNLVKIAHHGKRADAIVKGMLQHSRSSSGEKEPTDINALVDEYLRLSYHGLRAKDKSFNAIMKTDFDQSLSANGTGNGKINIVSQDIGRVVLNLLTNAFYVVNEKKQMNINGYEPTVSVSTKKTGNQVQIKVADNGNGIPRQALDKIFQPFFTTKPSGQGTGLGLSLSYDIVKAHGGELKVNTKAGEGTEFVIQLPA